jgi:beta-lactamase regulating signal transducer with metallopeptidase domain
LLWSNLRAVVLIALVFGLLSVWRTQGASPRHQIWLTALIGCLVLPLMTALLPSDLVSIFKFELPMAAGSSLPDATAAGIEQLGVEPESTALFRTLLTLYLLGFALVLGHFLVSVLRVARLESAMRVCADPKVNALKDALTAELGIGRPVRLLHSDLAGSPFTWGVWRPRVVLPAEAMAWTRERICNVLRHELCHVKRFDWFRLFLQRLATAVYWFNPVVWFAFRQCQFEAERACDDFVLGSGGRPAEYAEQLVDLMASSRDAHAFGVALGEGDFTRRVRAILNSSREVQAMSKLRTRSTIFGVALSALVLAACQVTNSQPTGAGLDPAAPDAAARQEAEQQLIEARARAESAEGAARASRDSAVAEREAREAQLTQAVAEREQMLLETREQLRRQERAVAELRLALEQQASALAQKDRALGELQLRLEEVSIN